MKFHLDNNIVEGTPEELVKYQELIEEKEKEKEEELLKSGHMHVGYQEEEVEPPTELQVGDRVKVLKSEGGAEEVATVTAVYGHGDVSLAGTSKRGLYLEDWINHVSNLEKIEEEEDKYMGYTFWYIDDSIFNNRVVLKTTLWDYLEDSKGRRYTYKEVHGLTSPINKKIAREEFEEAKNNDGLLRYYSSLDVFSWE